MKENKWSAALCRKLRGSGAEVLNVTGNALQGTGWPDLMLFTKGKFIGIELKIESRPLRATQIARLRKLRRQNILCVVMRWTEVGPVICDEMKGEIVVLEKESLNEIVRAAEMWEEMRRNGQAIDLTS